MDYLQDPEAIYARSFETVRRECDLSAVPEADRPLVIRVVHACGMPEIAAALRFSPGILEAIARAIVAGAPVLADCEAVRHGIIRRFLPPAAEIVCTLNDPRVRSEGTTRSAAAVRLWRPRLGGAVAVVGNAPTALFALLEEIDAGAPKPAAIVAFPVGFVGAAEAKAELLADPRGIPFVTLPGRRGGSAMAAAAVNAAAESLPR